MSCDVKIHWYDAVYMKVECSQSILFEIHETFSFFVPGYRFMPAYKIGRWSGKIHLIDLRSRKMYRGLLSDLTEFCQEGGYSLEIVNPQAFETKVKFDPLWLTRWNEYSWLQPHQHQFNAVAEALAQNNLLILSPTASGKSLIIYLIVRYLLENTHDDILITVPTTSLVEQLFTDFEDYAKDTTWNTAENCHRIYSGKEKQTQARVTISTWQSIYKLDKGWFARFGAYICDEAHLADAKSITGIIDKLENASVRLGLTGTIEDAKLHALELKGRFGALYRAATTRELQDKDIIADMDIEVVRLKYSDEERKLVRGMPYDQEIEFLVTHPLRNRVLCNLALQSDKNCIMLFNFVERHGDILYDMLKSKAQKYGKQIFYVHGGVEVEDREAIRRICEKIDNGIILASFGTFSTGVNLKNLHRVIFCHPYKAKIKTLQSIGRSLRKLEDKKAILNDIADDLVVKSRNGSEKLNHTMKHFIDRLKIYQNEQFNYRIIPVALNT